MTFKTTIRGSVACTQLIICKQLTVLVPHVILQVLAQDFIGVTVTSRFVVIALDLFADWRNQTCLATQRLKLVQPLSQRRHKAQSWFTVKAQGRFAVFFLCKAKGRFAVFTLQRHKADLLFSFSCGKGIRPARKVKSLMLWFYKHHDCFAEVNDFRHWWFMINLRLNDRRVVVQ